MEQGMSTNFDAFMQEQLEDENNHFETNLALLDDVSILVKIDKAASIQTPAERQLAVNQIMREIKSSKE